MTTTTGSAAPIGERSAKTDALTALAVEWHGTQDGFKFAAVRGHLTRLYTADPLGTLDRVAEAAACLLDAADIRDGRPGWQTKLVTYLDWIDPDARRFLSDQSTAEIREGEETARSVALDILDRLVADEAAAQARGSAA